MLKETFLNSRGNWIENYQYYYVTYIIANLEYTSTNVVIEDIANIEKIRFI